MLKVVGEMGVGDACVAVVQRVRCDDGTNDVGGSDGAVEAWD